MDALGVAGDVSSAGAALAGLLLVFMGSIATSYDSYHSQIPKPIRTKYKLRIWFAFLGFVLALVASFLALLGKWLAMDCVAVTAIIALFASFAVATLAAARAALDVG
jgi:hypothetical protein